MAIKLSVPPVIIFPGAASSILQAGIPVIALHGPMLGGMIFNPSTSQDQRISVVEPIFVDASGNPATLFESSTTIAIKPGSSYTVPEGQTNSVSVNAATVGHTFTSLTIQIAIQFPPTVTQYPFPPIGPTGLLTTIPAYLYEEYNTDQDLQAFIDAFNSMAQAYLDWFNNINLPIYTNPQINGALLDWVLGGGLYGIPRPTLSSGRQKTIGPFNTIYFNQIAFNRIQRIGPKNVALTSDDIYKRIATWHLYRGDGFQFNVRWLKRRILRFLYGTNGTDYNGPSYQISVEFGVNNQITITIVTGVRNIIRGYFNSYTFNSTGYNQIISKFRALGNKPQYADIFKTAMDNGALEMPFQYTISVIVGQSSHLPATFPGPPIPNPPSRQALTDQSGVPLIDQSGQPLTDN